MQTHFASALQAVHIQHALVMVLPPTLDIDGQSLTQSLTGKVFLVINVASQCGLTNQSYDLLRKLVERFDSSDFAVVAIPCNTFGGQEPGEPCDIRTFAVTRAPGIYITEKSGVNGPETHPLVAIAKVIFPEKVTWNFEGRYIFSKYGSPVARFTNSSTDNEIVRAIQQHV